jgi:hypothetical protein
MANNANPATQTQRPDQGTWPGGTHNPGEPTGYVVRRHLRLPSAVLPEGTGRGGAHGTMPIKGTTEADRATAAMEKAATQGPNRPGVQEVYVIVQGGNETPVFAVGDGGRENAIAVFSLREKAVLFLQQANWQAKYDPRDLAPSQLQALVEEARKQGVQLLAVDFSHQGGTQTTPENTVRIDDLPDRSGENLYRTVWERGNG